MLFSIRASADAANEHQSEQALTLPVRTGVSVAMAAEFQPGSLNIRTGVAVAIGMANDVRMPITTGILAVANATAFRPFRTGITFTLRPEQAPGVIRISTGLTVSITAAGQPTLSRNRDLIIAAQSDLAATTLTKVILLGIELIDPEFRSVANLGFIRLANAGDVKFNNLANGTELNHNIVSHDPVSGRIVFDLELPLWTVNEDFPARMSYGDVSNAVLFGAENVEWGAETVEWGEP